MSLDYTLKNDDLHFGCPVIKKVVDDAGGGLRVIVKWGRLESPVEEHCSIGGSIISRLDNGAFVGLIYELLVSLSYTWK